MYDPVKVADRRRQKDSIFNHMKAGKADLLTLR